MSKPKTYKIATLGCRTNQYESEAYQNQLKYAGYKEAVGDEEADLCIVNTCTVTHSADSHSRNQIRKLRKKYPKAHIAVTGCMVEKNSDALLEIPEANWVISNKNKEQLLNQIYPQESFPEFALEEMNSQTRAFIKIQDGCNSFCSYCIIPYVRGRSKSRTLVEIVKEVKTLISNGVKEVVLTGINIGDFDGNDSSGSTRLCHLVQALDQLEGLERIRISSIDPDEVDQELIETLKQGKKTCKSMHIVLQSGSNWILKRMNRKYTKQNFFETVDRLKALSPDFTFTTDIIVGFPGEREIDFQDTLEVMKEVRFAKVHMFPYSKRERTKAALFIDHLPPEIIQERKNTVLHLAEQLAFELRTPYVGRTLQILTEGSESGEFEMDTIGYSDNFLKVILPEQKKPTNTLVNVRIIENSPEGLIGKAIV